MRPLSQTSPPFKAPLALTVLLGIVIALAFLYAAPAAAQQVEAGEATVSLGDGKAVAKAGDTVAKAGEGTGATKVQAGNTTVEIETQSNGNGTNTARVEVVQSGTQATPGSGENGAQEEVSQQGNQRASQTASRATASLANRAATITESPNDTDDIVDRITAPGASCDVDADAVVVVEDDDGTRVRLVNGQNATISATDDQITIVGTATGGNLAGISPNGGNQQFGTEAETVTGSIVSSAGITCGASMDDDDNSGGGSEGETLDPNGCTRLLVLDGSGKENGDFALPTGADRLRVVYGTSSPNGSIEIGVATNNIRVTPLISETVTGAETGVITEDAPSNVEIDASVTPTDQTYKVVFEAVGGDDECAAPEKLENDVLSDTVPNKPLPDTGGPPLLALAALGFASAVVGASVLRAGMRRKE